MNMLKNISGNKYFIPTLISALLIILLALMIWSTIYQSKNYTDKLIIEDLIKIDAVLKKINKDAGIKSIGQDKSNVDFLNVVKFAGSQIGPLNLKNPERWKGPYLVTNPTIQEKFYQILKNNNVYFVVPADGVKLANGKIIGKDIILNNESDMQKLMKDKDSLLSSYGSPLAIKVKVLNQTSNSKPALKNSDIF